MSEIVIDTPQVNRNPFRDFAYRDRDFVETFGMQLDEMGITSLTHPTAIDLYSGDGSFARMLVDNGWDPSNIICVDRARSLKPLVKGVTWRYWNLDIVGKRILSRRYLPKEVSTQRTKFDIAIVVGTFRGCSFETELAGYFTRTGGLSYTGYHQFSQLSDGRLPEHFCE